MKKQKKIYVVSLLLSVAATSIASGAMGIMMNPVIDFYNLESSQEGMMSSCISAGALLALVAGMFLRSRVRKADFIIWGGFLMSIMLTVKSVSMSFLTFLAVCFLMGVGNGITDSYQSAFLADILGSDAKKGLGVLHGIFGIAGFILPLCLSRLLKTYTWRQVYLIIGSFSLVLLSQFLFSTKTLSDKIPGGTMLEEKLSFNQTIDFIKNPFFCLLLLCMFLGAAGQNGILVWTVRYVSFTLSDQYLAPVCLSLYWIATSVSRIFSPRLPFPALRILAVGSAISGIGWGIGVFSNTSFGICAACVVAGMTSGCCIPLLLGIGAEFSSRDTGLVTSMLMFVKTAGQIICPVVIAQIQSAGGLRNAVYTIAPVFIVDGAIAFILNRMKKRNAFL
ncbi:MAG TPA: MFS transporter [Candidatus Mediterraneibacter norfolkensis]|nr:MFS transporter [Candidatus Mediterraneibacter norfolkensis]